MSQRKKIIPTLAELKNDMKDMAFRQKMEHLWMYYKEYALLAFIALLLVIATVTSILTKLQTPIVRGMMVNISISQKAYDYLTDDYFEKMGGRKGKDEVSMFYRNFTSLADPTSGEDNYNSAQALTTQVSAGLLDYAIMDKMALEFYITQRVFMDLREIFTPEELAELAEKDMLVYAVELSDREELFDPEDEEDLAARFPVAVKMASLPFVQDNTKSTDIYFIVGGNNPNVEAVRSVWAHILAWGT